MAARYTAGVDHKGRSKAFARPGEAKLAVHHDPNAARAQDHLHGDTSVARNGAPKRFHPVSVHNGMTRRQQTMNAMGHATEAAPDANPANPLSKEPSGKAFVGQGVPTYPGMRSRTAPAGILHGGAPGHEHRVMAKYSNELTAVRHELGRRVLDEAFSCAAPDDCRAHGRTK